MSNWRLGLLGPEPKPLTNRAYRVAEVEAQHGAAVCPGSHMLTTRVSSYYVPQNLMRHAAG